MFHVTADSITLTINKCILKAIHIPRILSTPILPIPRYIPTETHFQNYRCRFSALNTLLILPAPSQKIKKAKKRNKAKKCLKLNSCILSNSCWSIVSLIARTLDTF